MTSSSSHEGQHIIEHISELRKRLLYIVLATAVGTTLAHIFHVEIISFLLRPAGTQELIFLSPLEPFIFILKVDITVGLLLASPLILWQVLSFISPAFSVATKRVVVLFSVLSFLLIVGGVLYAFLVTIPLSLKFLFSIVIAGIHNQISAQNYISFFLTQALIIAAIFQIPVLIIGGTYLRLVSTKLFKNKRRYVYLVVTIALAIITPTTDIFSLSVVLIPCIVIFECSLMGAKIVERLRKREG